MPLFDIEDTPKIGDCYEFDFTAIALDIENLHKPNKWIFTDGATFDLHKKEYLEKHSETKEKDVPPLEVSLKHFAVSEKLDDYPDHYGFTICLPKITKTQFDGTDFFKGKVNLSIGMSQVPTSFIYNAQNVGETLAENDMIEGVFWFHASNLKKIDALNIKLELYDDDDFSKIKNFSKRDNCSLDDYADKLTEFFKKTSNIQAYNKLLEICDIGNATALHNLATLYHCGWGVVDICGDNAKRLYERSLELCDDTYTMDCYLDLMKTMANPFEFIEEHSLYVDDDNKLYPFEFSEEKDDKSPMLTLGLIVVLEDLKSYKAYYNDEVLKIDDKTCFIEVNLGGELYNICLGVCDNIQEKITPAEFELKLLNKGKIFFEGVGIQKIDDSHVLINYRGIEAIA